MTPLPFIDVHSHNSYPGKDSIVVKNIFPGDGFAAFSGRNFYSVGLHPWYLKSEDENNEMLTLVEDALEFDHVIFVGECGPDPNTKTDFSEQMRVFEAQAFMAEEYQKPLIIHCVKAYNEVIRVYKKLNPIQPWILHGYNGNLQTTKQLEERNFLFSFGEILFREKAKAIESFEYLPVERIFFETDETKEGIEKIYRKGASVKKMKLKKLQKEVLDNFNRIENIQWNG